MNWLTANNRRRFRERQATPAFVRRNLDRWRGMQCAELSKAIHDERLGRKRERVPVRSNLKVISISFDGPIAQQT